MIHKMIRRVISAVEAYGLIGTMAKALSSPSVVVRTLLPKRNQRIVLECLTRMVADITGEALPEIRRYLYELRQDNSFWLEFQQACKTKGLECYDHRCGAIAAATPKEALDYCRPHAIAWYLLVRAAKPEIVVETGVYLGWSSALVLRAMERNGKGRLYSVDLPATKEHPFYDPHPKGVLCEHKLDGASEVGSLVPEHLRTRWSLWLGHSKEVLPKLLGYLGLVDVFIHDSDHSYENMTYEFEMALHYLRPTGYILSDNIDWNSSFSDFAGRHGLRAVDERAYLPSAIIETQSQIVGIIRRG